jgi:peptide-methionine (S)-S-oxide reductase
MQSGELRVTSTSDTDHPTVPGTRIVGDSSLQGRWVMRLFGRDKTRMPTVAEALPGRYECIAVAEQHFVLDAPLSGPFPDGFERIMVGMGCFWGAERMYWQADGVFTTAVGYAAGVTPNPTYEEVCSGLTGHNEVVLAVYDPAVVSYAEMVGVFWEGHDPTQGMRQGNDVGTQYRSGLYVFDDAQRAVAENTRDAYQQRLEAAGFGAITTEIVDAPVFYYAEDHHQQYLAKNPNGYCGIGGTGVSCPVGLTAGD